MDILVLLGSPHRNGSSNTLANEFIKGAKENENSVEILDIAHMNLNPCIGCDCCGMDGVCIQNDDMSIVKEAICRADMLVFVTPLYYFGMSAQLKIMIDRFYSFNTELSYQNKKSVLIAAAWNSSKNTMKDLFNHYLTLCDYLHFENMGSILGLGCGTVNMTKMTKYIEEAYMLGRKIK